MNFILEANINMSNTFYFPKLTGFNYNFWAASMKSALQSCFYGFMSIIKKICLQLSNLLFFQLIKYKRNIIVEKKTESSIKPDYK